ncbi:hypothetical protein [Desulfosarcina ovata]|uniref:hypothetical protein n=1 Tax=Desulfosarcina ovata TaxID=83564 RepID=UPI0012D3060A|nr:hypothetical protein [Desulfosarcina ovata]
MGDLGLNFIEVGDRAGGENHAQFVIMLYATNQAFSCRAKRNTFLGKITQKSLFIGGTSHKQASVKPAADCIKFQYMVYLQHIAWYLKNVRRSPMGVFGWSDCRAFSMGHFQA